MDDRELYTVRLHWLRGHSQADLVEEIEVEAEDELLAVALAVLESAVGKGTGTLDRVEVRKTWDDDTDQIGET